MSNLNTVQKLFCPKCGHGFLHTIKGSKKFSASVAGMAVGAKLGAGAGIAILGTAVSGAWVAIPVLAAGGYLIGKKASGPKCPECSTKFSV